MPPTIFMWNGRIRKLDGALFPPSTGTVPIPTLRRSGAGTLVYTHHVSRIKLREEWLKACCQDQSIRAFYGSELKQERIDLNERDVAVLSAGVHVAHNERRWYMQAYQDLFQCYSHQKSRGRLTSWPKMVNTVTLVMAQSQRLKNGATKRG
eukprot:scaffold136735_cov48-Attheya_sp.AAC.2